MSTSTALPPPAQTILRRRQIDSHVPLASDSSIPDISLSPPQTSRSSTPTPTPASRPRAYSCYLSSSSSSYRAPSPASSLTNSPILQSLDLSHPSSDSAPPSTGLQAALWSLRKYLLGRVEEAEEGVRKLRELVSEESGSGSSSEEGDETERDGDACDVVHGRKARVLMPSVPEAPDTEKEAERDTEGDASSAISALEQFIAVASLFLAALRAELPTLSFSTPLSPLSATSTTPDDTDSDSSTTAPSPFLHLQLSPEARLALDHFLFDHPLPTFPTLSLPSAPHLNLNLKARLDDSKHSAAAVLTSVNCKLKELQNALEQLATVGAAGLSGLDARSLTDYIPSLPSKPLPPLAALRDYFKAESERLTTALSSLSLELAIPAIPSLPSALEAVKDEAALLYFAALEEGKRRLLRYEELPHEWRNNEHILSGYRFIEVEEWGRLVRSAWGWHNETLNIQSHLLGAVSLLYLLVVLLPLSPHTLPHAHIGDTAIALLFVGAAIKCLLCSTAWHLFSGCASGGWHRRAACVDYVGISALIAASVMGMEYYGFYCRPKLAVAYMSFSAFLGVAGMILPWQPWFNQRKYKMWRIAFFLGLAASALMPMGHMALLYGVGKTIAFIAPGVPSVLAYLVGLSFYATQFPEMMSPGRWDILFSSHQIWHAAIVAAIWLHWHALTLWAAGALQVGGDQFSCALDAPRGIFWT